MTMPILDQLQVWWGGRVAGTLSIDKGGAMHFAYAAEWLADPQAPPVSHAMPKRDVAYDDALCKAVFGGLLPEEGQRTAVARALGVSPDNPFRLLEALGGDVAGALAFLPHGAVPVAGDALRSSEALREDDLVALIARIPQMSMLAGQGGARLSLAGAQAKLPVVLSGGVIAVPCEGEPSTHLIKPEPERFPGLAANEAFCLTLARAIGLAAAFAERREVGGKAFLLVTRYDRAGEAGYTERLHQEDFAQALGVAPNHKYAAEGGPGFRDCFALLRRATTRPARDVLKLADAAIFNLIIGNADAHAKNFSLLRSRQGGIQLAPLYDLVATHVWPELSPRLAMRFGGAATLEEVDRVAIVRFAAEAGLAAPFVRRRAAELAERVLNQIGLGVIVEGADVAVLADKTAERAGRLSLKANAR